MIDSRRAVALIALAGSLAGCGGGEVTAENRPAEQKAPDYGTKSMDKMKEMYGTPEKGGQLKK